MTGQLATCLSRHASNFRREASSLPTSHRLCDWMVFQFAGWTLACNAVVLLGGGLRSLVFAALGAAVLVAAAWFGLWRRIPATRGSSPAVSAATGASRPPQRGLTTGVRVGGVAAALLVVAAEIYRVDFRVVWFLAVTLLGSSGPTRTMRQLNSDR